MKKTFLFATLLYLITIITLLGVVYRFLIQWQLSEINFFIVGIVAILIVVGWGFVLLTLLEPKKALENRLTTLTKETLHELNIPLSTIQANTQLLERAIEDETSQKRLQRIEEATHRLTRLYQELLYSMRKEIQQIQKEPCDLKTLITQRLNYFQTLNRQNFHVTIPSPYTIFIDKIGFEKMIDNLLTNAMKYAPKESTISITLENHTLSIKDRGIGIAKTELVKIFERYYQSDQNQEGQGIGLSLVKAYCDSENIPIEIESTPNIGTEIKLHLSNTHSPL
jgi:two-component system OmpR family sensor kinase